MRSHSDYARQSDPVLNPHFRRTWQEMPEVGKRAKRQVKLITLPGLLDANGEPRAGLVIEPPAGAVTRRPIFKMFTTIAAAVSAKRALEAGR